MGKRVSRSKSRARPVLRFLARYGCFSIGTVYILIGVWAELALYRLAEPAADEERILHRLLEFPFGNVFIILIAAGTLGYMVWRVYEACVDPYGFGSHFRGRVERTTTALGALVYGVIAVAALKVLAGRGGHGEEGQRTVAAHVLEWPGGPWILGIVGVTVGLTGLYQLKYVYAGDHRVRLRTGAMPKAVRILADILAWSGFLARCAILLVLGGFLLDAALTLDPRAVGDTDSAFDFLGSNLPFGHKIFTGVALGTIGYGLFLYLNGIFFESGGG